MSAPTSSSTNAIIIQYEFCTGCHACEVACKKEKELEKGQFGIKVMQYGPAKLPEGKNRWEYFFIPVPTSLCDLCQSRLDEGKLPACVHNCQSKVMEVGPVEELAKKVAEIPNCVLYAPTVK